jgi:hypothetical protein
MRNESLYETAMWCGRRLEKIRRTDRVRNEKYYLESMRTEYCILQTVTGRKANWTGHTLNRNCLLKHVNEGKIEGRKEVTEGRRRKREQLLDDLKKTTEYRKLKEKALDRTLWRTRFGRGYGPVVIETTKWMNYI